MEQVEVAKADVEKKVERILKLIKRRNRAKKEPEIVGLVEDFHKQYQSLYAQYDHLKRESSMNALDGKGNESCSYYASGSDSEYYSSEDTEINSNILLNNDKSFQKSMAESIQEELERAYVKVPDLNHQLPSKSEQKEALEAQQHQKRGLEAQLDGESKTAESSRQGETNKALHGLSSEEGNVVTKLIKQIKDNENNLTSKIENSMAQIGNLKKEVDYLCIQKCEAEGRIACKSNETFDQGNVMKQELDSLRRQKTESEILLERKSREISQYLIQVKTLKEELARKSAVEQTMVEEKECLQVQVMDLESEVDALRKQKIKSEDEERSNIREINQLRAEKGHLNARILELEALLRERGLELSAIQEDSKSKRNNKETAQIMTLNAEIELLQQKLDSLKMDKSQLELWIADKQRITKEREERTNKSTESNSKLTRRWSSVTNLNFHVLERKMEDLAQEFNKKVEDNIRLLYQRITVAEKMHFEIKDICKKMKERLEQENGALGEKLATCEAEFRKLRDSMEPGKNASTGLNSVVNKSEDDGINSLTRLSNVKDEHVSANGCDPGREDETEQLKSNMDLVVSETDKENELLREKVLSLEAKLSEEGEEKLKLLKTVTELGKRVGELEKIRKQRDETLLGREEEKREAIRQLCLLIDYHRSRCDYLKELISKLAVRSKKKT